MKIIQEKTVKTTHYSLSHKDIADLLAKKGVFITKNDEVEIFVRVPGGGDWSNTNLEINEETPLQVKITEHA